MTDETSTPTEGEKPEAKTESSEGQTPPADEGKTPEAKTFDEEYVKGLRSEAAKNRRDAQAAAAKLQELEDAEKSELEKARSVAERETKARESAEADLRRFRVAAAKQVPADLVQFLTATTDEELEAQADTLLERIKPQPTSMDGGVRENTPEPKTVDQRHSDFLMGVFGKPNT